MQNTHAIAYIGTVSCKILSIIMVNWAVSLIQEEREIKTTPGEETT